MELSSGQVTDPGAMFAWVGYLVISLWAFHIVRSEGKGSALLLVVVLMLFSASLAMVEILFDAAVTAFDFTTTFGEVMMLGVLAGTLAVGSRMIWAGSIAFAIAMWSIAMGLLRQDPISSIGVRAVIAVAGVIFTTALVTKLFDQLAYAIEQYNRSRRLHDAVAKCSEALLVQTDTFAVHEAVKAVLEATDADYGYVDRTVEVDGEPGWEIVADAAKRTAGYGNSWKTGVYSSIPSIFDALSRGKAVVVHTSELSGRERELYLEDGIQSEVTVPILMAGSFRGSIGFVQYTSDRLWHNSEIQTLWRAAHMIGAYWQRQDQAEALRASNESKDRLLASVSHEIRTPLTAIVGLSEEIISNRMSMAPQELDELNGIIAVQSRELAELVEDLLVASRADFGNLSIKPEAIDLMKQADRVVAGVRDAHRSKKEIVLEGEKTTAWADPLRVRQVIRNLLTNAIKYGGQKITVRTGVQGDLAQVLVTDDGPGVSRHETDLIFERYYRSAGSPTQPGSVGIGLAVSRQLAEMMGGSLDYVSGEGHHYFELSLPVYRLETNNGSRTIDSARLEAQPAQG